MIVRPITRKDLHQYAKLAEIASPGLTHLPNNPGLLKKNLEISLDSFQSQIQQPQNESYIFVLEDPETGKILGTSCVKSKTGIERPLYFYQLHTLASDCSFLPLEKEMEILTLVSYINAPSELCGLFIHPEARQEGLGKLISLSRFLFMAAFPERFDPLIFAEMRGNATEDGIVFFWEAVGRHFLNINYPELLKLYTEDLDFIPHLLPKFPIYTSLLPESAQETLGKPHRQTVPAFKMLIKEGLLPSGEIDVFDGGPRLIGQTQELLTVTNSKTVMLEKIEEIEGEKALIANEKLAFRCCYGPIRLNDNKAILTKKTAEALQVKPGETIRYIQI